MELKKENFWPQEKAQKYVRIASVLIMCAGIIGLLMSLDDFIQLGWRVSAFIFPYLYNIITFSLSVFQIYLGKLFPLRKSWVKNAVFVVIGMRFLMGFFDHAELWAALVVLVYLVYILKPSRVGWLFQENIQA
jgi:hypothetical protein